MSCLNEVFYNETRTRSHTLVMSSLHPPLPDEFQCSQGNRCIPLDQVCDGQYQCPDRSDEANCLVMMKGCHHRCDNNTRCIPETFLCDGERDCADGSDETKCGRTHWFVDKRLDPCSSKGGMCIPRDTLKDCRGNMNKTKSFNIGY